MGLCPTWAGSVGCQDRGHPGTPSATRTATRSMCTHGSSPLAEPGLGSGVGGVMRVSWGWQTPVCDPPRAEHGDGMAAPGRSWPQLPEEGPGTGQRRLNSAVSVSGRAINKSVGGNGGDESEATRRESHLQRNTLPKSSTPPRSGAKGGFVSEGVLVLLELPDNPLPGERWGTALPAAALATAGGCSPLPIPGAPPAPRSWVHPAPWDRVGWGIAPAPGAALRSRFPPRPGANFAFWGAARPQPQGEGLPSRKQRPGLLPRVAAQQPWRQARPHLLCSPSQILSKRGRLLINAELSSRLQCCRCCLC